MVQTILLESRGTKVLSDEGTIRALENRLTILKGVRSERATAELDCHKNKNAPDRFRGAFHYSGLPNRQGPM